MVHVHSVIEEYEKRGAIVVGIMAQNPIKVKEYVEKNDLGFMILTDHKREMIKDYGVHVKLNFESVNVARHSVFILDGGGYIKYMHIGKNQTDWPPDDEIFKVLDELRSGRADR